MSRADPVEIVRRLLERARDAGEAERGTALTLATATAEGRPSARMVLLKGIDAHGFVFYTNTRSRKAAELAANPHAALVFYWPGMRTQVRVEGAVEPVADADADAYFATRPRQSQLGAWASQQSAPLKGRRELVTAYLRQKVKHAGAEVPRPPFWGGFRLAPLRIEIWRSRLGRLHDRELYERRADGGWDRTLLYP